MCSGPGSRGSGTDIARELHMRRNGHGNAAQSNGNAKTGRSGRRVPPSVVEATVAKVATQAKVNGNGHADAAARDLDVLLDALQAVRGGDFSVRLPRNQLLLAGKIADAFNEIVTANERM